MDRQNRCGRSCRLMDQVMRWVVVVGAGEWRQRRCERQVIERNLKAIQLIYIFFVLQNRCMKREKDYGISIKPTQVWRGVR